MMSVIKTARVAELAFPLHGQNRPGRRPSSAPAGAGAGANAAGTARDEAGAVIGPVRSEVAVAPVPGDARAGQEMGATGATVSADPRDNAAPNDSAAPSESAALPPGIPATYAEGHEDGHAEGLREGYRKGREEGLAEGLEQGRREACESANAQESRTRALADAIGAVSAGWQAELEAGAIEIAHAALLRIIGEAAGSRDAVVAMVRKVMEQLPERRALSIHLSPADVALLEADMARLALGGATLVADERVELGGCIVDTDAGSLDARLETQLAGLRDLLLALHRSGGETE